MSAAENTRAPSNGEINPGRRLAEARQAQNLTPADVARHLKLSVWQVEALESGRYDRLPGPIFVRGFIRNYARLVRLDPEALAVAAGDRILLSEPGPMSAPSQEIPFPGAARRNRRLWAVGGLLVFALLAAYEFHWGEPARDRTEVALAPPVAAVAQAPVTPDAGNSPERFGAPTAAPAPGSEPAAPVQNPNSAPPVVTTSSPETAPGPGEKEVRLVFGEESWVEIRDHREQVIFSQLNPAGSRQAIAGTPPLSVVVGNAHSVRLTYDGKPVDLAPHTRADVARLMLQ